MVSTIVCARAIQGATLSNYSIGCPHCGVRDQYVINGAFGKTELNCKSCSKSFTQGNPTGAVVLGVVGIFVTLAAFFFVFVLPPNAEAVRACAQVYNLRPGQYGTTRGLNGGEADAVMPRYPNGDRMFPDRKVWAVILARPGGNVMLNSSGTVASGSDEPVAYCMVEYDERWGQWRDVSDPAGYRLNRQ